MARRWFGGGQLPRKVAGVMVIITLAWSHSLVASANVRAEELERLFYTPEDRAVLEILRQSSVRPTQPSVAPTDKVEGAENRPKLFTLGGTVTRKDGVQAVWLNGQPYPATGLQVNVEVEKPHTAGQVVLQVPETGKRYPLRPGQTLDLTSGRIRESYEPLPVAASVGTKAGVGSETGSPAGPVSDPPVKP